MIYVENVSLQEKKNGKRRRVEMYEKVADGFLSFRCHRNPPFFNEMLPGEEQLLSGGAAADFCGSTLALDFLEQSSFTDILCDCVSEGETRPLMMIPPPPPELLWSILLLMLPEAEGFWLRMTAWECEMSLNFWED